MDDFTACGLIEGFVESELPEDEQEDEQLAAWQQLVNSGLVWQLQGFYGRTATDLIERGLIEPAQGDAA